MKSLDPTPHSPPREGPRRGQHGIEVPALVRASDVVRASPHLPRPIVQLLCTIFRGARRTPTVALLATRSGVDRSTLTRRWRRVLPDADALRLEDVLGWTTLLSARELYARTGSWKATAAQMAISRTTLTRLGARLAEMSLQEIAQSPEELARRFDAQVLDLLSQPQAK